MNIVTNAWIAGQETRRTANPENSYCFTPAEGRWKQSHVSVMGITAGVAYIGMALLEAETAEGLAQAISSAETGLDSCEHLARHEAF